MSDENPHTDAETSPIRSVHHDVLMINPNRELYRFNVRKAGDGRVGEYTSVEFRGAGAPGYRKVMHIARKGPPDKVRGIAFGTLPVKEEPASSFMCCYLINSENLTYRNVWTQAEWNDAPEPGDDQQPTHEAHERDVRLLIAEHSGRVLYLHIPKGTAKDGAEKVPAPDVNKAKVQIISLTQNPEIWNLLRNGCVAGSARYKGDDTPLLNLTSLLPEREERRHERPLGDGLQITGTLDFKWTRRAEREHDVVVAFLPVATRTYGVTQWELYKAFEKYARRWQLEKLVDAADVKEHEKRGLRVRFETERAFDPAAPFDYDILVSLAPLDGTTKDEQGKPVKIPMAELGSYARRVDRGHATFFAGMPKGLQVQKDKEMLPTEYPTSKAFQQFVVHEFGHALGLVHLHQHPQLSEAALAQLSADLDKKEGQSLEALLAKRLKNALGITVPENYFEEAVSGQWPGDERYCEWPKELANLRDQPKERLQGLLKDLLKDSIMTGLAGHADGKMGELAPDKHRTQPSQLDIEWLQSLYPTAATRHM